LSLTSKLRHPPRSRESQYLVRNANAVRRTQADRTEISDQRLTDAAVQLLLQKGVRGTTLAELGRLAGYSRGLATHRFGSKAGLLQHVLQRASARWLALLQSKVGDTVGADALCAAVDAHLELLRKSPDDVRVMYLLWFTSIDPGSEYRANVARVHQAQRDDIRRWIKLGQQRRLVPAHVDASRVAEQFCASMAGMACQWLVNAKIPLQEMHQQLKADIRQRLAAAERTPARASRVKSQGNHDDRRVHI
jgi:AcrR family transcriptional regulator